MKDANEQTFVSAVKWLTPEERALLYLQMQFLQETKMELDRKVSCCYVRVNLGPLLNGEILNYFEYLLGKSEL